MRGHGVPVFSDFEELHAAGPFDVCLSTSVVEHLASPLEGMRQIAELLKPGGLAYVTGIIGAAQTLGQWQAIDKAIKSSELIPKKINPWEHLNYFTEATLNQLMAKAGFEKVPNGGSLWRKINRY